MQDQEKEKKSEAEKRTEKRKSEWKDIHDKLTTFSGTINFYMTILAPRNGGAVEGEQYTKPIKEMADQFFVDDEGKTSTFHERVKNMMLEDHAAGIQPDSKYSLFINEAEILAGISRDSIEDNHVTVSELKGISNNLVELIKQAGKFSGVEESAKNIEEKNKTSPSSPTAQQPDNKPKKPEVSAAHLLTLYNSANDTNKTPQQRGASLREIFTLLGTEKTNLERQNNQLGMIGDKIKTVEKRLKVADAGELEYFANSTLGSARAFAEGILKTSEGEISPEARRALETMMTQSSALSERLKEIVADGKVDQSEFDKKIEYKEPTKEHPNQTVSKSFGEIFAAMRSEISDLSGGIQEELAEIAGGLKAVSQATSRDSSAAIARATPHVTVRADTQTEKDR